MGVGEACARCRHQDTGLAEPVLRRRRDQQDDGQDRGKGELKALPGGLWSSAVWRSAHKVKTPPGDIDRHYPHCPGARHASVAIL